MTLKPCGTRAAYRRHRRAGETPCDSCREAKREYDREYRKTNVEAIRKRNREYNKANADARREWRKANAEALREWEREYRKANAEAIRETRRKNYEANAEARREYAREWQKANAEAKREYMREYRKANLDAIRERHREWQKANPEKRGESGRRRRAYKNGAEGSHTEAEWLILLEAHGGMCAYCETAPATTRDHLDPISKGGSDYIENIVPACGSCNSSKGDRFLWEWRRADELLRVS